MPTRRSGRYRSRPARPRLIALILGVVTALLTGCTLGPSSRPELAVSGAGAPAGPSDGRSAPAPSQRGELSGEWRPCGELDPVSGRAAEFEVRCNQMSVPLDYRSPSFPRLTLYLGRARSPGLAEDAPTLVLIAGAGPFEATLAGVNGLPTAAAALPAGITDRYQIVSLDLRGSGWSVNADCFRTEPVESLFGLPAAFDSAAARADLAALTRSFTFGCQDNVGATVSFYGTSQIVDDLDTLRSALDLDRLDLLGAGYGATVGALYVSRYPATAGRTVLDGPTDHSVAALERATRSAEVFERTLAAFAADCAAAADCPLGSDPAATVARAIQALGSGPVRSGPAWLAPGSALWAMVLALPDRSRWPDLAAALAGAARGEAAALQMLLDDIRTTPAVSLSSRLVLQCNDTAQRPSDDEVDEALSAAAGTAPTFGPFLVALATLCRQWPTPDFALTGVRAPDAPPVLVVGGLEDPVSPHPGVQAVARQIAGSVLVSHAGRAHGGVAASSCVAGHVAGFLVDGTLPDSGVLCPP